MPKRDRSALGAEIQNDMSREGRAAAFRETMVDHFRAHISGTRINEQTLIAGAYLDTFRDLVAMLEALSRQKKPRTKTLSGWQPVTYEQHFAQRGAGEKTLAVAAYRLAPPQIRSRFDEAVARLQAEALRLIAQAGKGGRNERASTLVEGAARLSILIDEAAAIADGEEPARREQASAPSEAARIAV